MLISFGLSAINFRLLFCWFLCRGKGYWYFQTMTDVISGSFNNFGMLSFIHQQPSDRPLQSPLSTSLQQKPVPGNRYNCLYRVRVCQNCQSSKPHKILMKMYLMTSYNFTSYFSTSESITIAKTANCKLQRKTLLYRRDSSKRRTPVEFHKNQASKVTKSNIE